MLLLRLFSTHCAEYSDDMKWMDWWKDATVSAKPPSGEQHPRLDQVLPRPPLGIPPGLDLVLPNIPNVIMDLYVVL